MGVLVLFVLLAAPFVFTMAGLIQLCKSDVSKKRRGRNLLLAGFAMLAIFILIGYSVCSNMHIGGNGH